MLSAEIVGTWLIFTVTDVAFGKTPKMVSAATF
jgi:hypothetical protein